VYKVERFHGFEHATAHALGAGSGRFRQQHHELFPTIARNEVGWSLARRPQGMRHLPQALVAFLVSVTVVVQFEVIYIDQQQRQCVSGTPGARPLMRQQFIE
jgi:hypothetical protein